MALAHAWVVVVLMVLASACLCCGSLWPWSSSQVQEDDIHNHQQHDDVLDAARDKVFACLESWTERDTEYLASECFDQRRFEMKEPIPIPSMDAEEYLEALEQLLPAMPNARSSLGPVVLVDYDGARLKGAEDGGLKFAYRWRFNGTFLPKVKWLGWVGQGQEVAYDAFSVGTASWHREDDGIRVRMTEIRNYYSVVEVMLLFAMPEEIDTRRLRYADDFLKPRHTVGLDASQVEGQCARIREALTGDGSGLASLLAPSVELWRPYPIRPVVRGVDQVLSELNQERSTLSSAHNSRGFRLLVLEHFSGLGHCTIEYHKRGVAPMEEERDLWGFRIFLSHEDADDVEPTIDWEGVYEFELDEDLRVAVIREHFDPQLASLQMADFLERVRDQWGSSAQAAGSDPHDEL